MNRFLIIFYIFCGIQSISFSQEWKKELENEKITVYTKQGSEDNIKSYKAYSFISHPIEDIYEVYKDFDNYDKWFEELKEVKLFSSKTNDSVDVFTYYSVVGFPWPFNDRDMYTKLTIEKNPGQEYVLVSEPLKDSLKNDEYVRLENFYQHTVLTKENEKRTKILMEGKYDAGGAVPAWLINMFVVDSPQNSVENIESYLKEKKKK